MSVSSGWGRLTWDQSQWGGSTIIGAGWGAQTWNHGSWNDLNDVTISVTGFSIDTNLGIEGWSNNAYGRGAWGEFAADIGLLTGTICFFFFAISNQTLNQTAVVLPL